MDTIEGNTIKHPLKVPERRHLSLGLTQSDPHTAIIRAWLKAQLPGTDLSKLLRQTIVQGLPIGAAVARIEAQLGALVARGALPRADHAAGDAVQPADSAILDVLFDFGHLTGA